MNSKYLIFFILLTLLSACSSQKTISSKWQEKPESAISDIPRTAYQYNSDYKLFYLITNDDEHLYVNLKVDDHNLQKRLLMSGFTIWIDSSAKSKKYMGLNYQVDPNKMLMKPEETEKYLPLDENGKKTSLMSYFMGNMLQEPIGLNTQNDDIIYHFANDKERSLNFQLKLPITYFSNQPNSSPIISLLLESKVPENRMQKPQGQRPQMGMGNGGGRSGGGSGGPGGGGSRGGGQGGEREEMNGGNPDGQAQGQKVKDIKIELKKLQLSIHE